MNLCVYVKGKWKIWQVRKRQGVIWRKTVGCVYSCLKYQVFYLVIVYYLLLKLPFVQSCIFGRSCSRYWCYCWRGEGCSIPFLVWFHTCQNTAKRIICKICQICNLERMAILAEDSKQLLNKRRDISNNCVHNRRFFFI